MLQLKYSLYFITRQDLMSASLLVAGAADVTAVDVNVPMQQISPGGGLLKSKERPLTLLLKCPLLLVLLLHTVCPACNKQMLLHHLELVCVLMS